MVTVQWLEKNPNILIDLVRGYDVADIALNCGAMLRECLRYENLTKIVLHSPEFYNFFKYVEVSNFDLASDAFKSLKVPLLPVCTNRNPIFFFFAGAAQ
jgi:calcium binding protein 39